MLWCIDISEFWVSGQEASVICCFCPCWNQSWYENSFSTSWFGKRRSTNGSWGKSSTSTSGQPLIRCLELSINHRRNEAKIKRCIFEFHSSWVCCYYLLSQDLLWCTLNVVYLLEDLLDKFNNIIFCLYWRFLQMIKFLISDYCLFGSTHEENLLSLHF